ncbi:rhodanese-like domain-containing protein [Sphingomonas sp.]|uniref:rhodanese-like domain-containing protein n=1 Tax=Sphingomonas sp. TaxID=28214 RepID=UPI0038630C4E
MKSPTASQKDRPIILYGASGGRSALAGKTLQEMGYTEVYNLSFKDAVDASFPNEPVYRCHYGELRGSPARI